MAYFSKIYQLYQELANFFLKTPEIKYFRFAGLKFSLLNSATTGRSSHRPHVHERIGCSLPAADIYNGF